MGRAQPVVHGVLELAWPVRTGKATAAMLSQEWLRVGGAHRSEHGWACTGGRRDAMRGYGQQQ